MNLNKFKRMNIFMLALAVHCFLFLPLMSGYSWAADNIHLDKGKSSYDFLEYEEALIELNKALKVDGVTDQDFAQIYKYIGLTYIALGNKDKALDAFKRALRYYSNLEIEYQYSSPKIMEVFNEAKTPSEKKEPDKVPPSIEHIPFDKKVEPGRSIRIEAVISDNENLRLVTLYYKEKWRTTFSAVKMSLKGDNNYYAEIPGKVVTPEGTEYYIEAVDVAGNVKTRGNADFALPVLVKELAKEKPFYKKWWVWAIAGGVVVVAAALSGGGGGDSTSPTGTITINGPAP